MCECEYFDEQQWWDSLTADQKREFMLLFTVPQDDGSASSVILKSPGAKYKRALVISDAD